MRARKIHPPAWVRRPRRPAASSLKKGTQSARAARTTRQVALRAHSPARKSCPFLCWDHTNSRSQIRITCVFARENQSPALDAIPFIAASHAGLHRSTSVWRGTSSPGPHPSSPIWRPPSSGARDTPVVAQRTMNSQITATKLPEGRKPGRRSSGPAILPGPFRIGASSRARDP